MKYPCLILRSFCKTEIKVSMEREGVTKQGEPLEPVEWQGTCNYQDKAKTILTAEKKIIQISGCAYIPGDIAPELANITSGTIEIFGEKRKISTGMKARNPDGTVNYTRLDVE